mmetsp:Transcript_47147/g.145204  ORF Transcript_47147/g.145204 Transcript_47147/m.145204 type:complete len:310 (-) Transcript_47147:158-1087(-)
MSEYDRSAPSDFGSNLSSSLTSTLRFFRSVSNSSRKPARCTLTATGMPLYTARCTCPSDAAAIGSSSNESKTSSTGAPSSLPTISIAFAPPKPGTLSCRSRSTSMYSFSSTSVRVDTTCPSLTNVGPNLKRESRMNSAAAVFAAEAASGPPLAFEALSTLSAAEARNAQTSSVRFSADPCALLSHPASISSPVAASSAAVASPREKRSVRLITPTRLLTVRRYTDSSVHTSGSSRSHDSSTISFAASSRVRRRVRAEPTDRSAPRTASLFLWRRAGDAVTIGASASATTDAALTASNSASSDDTDSTAR